MKDDTLQIIGILLLVALVIIISKAIWEAYMDRFTHDCLIKVKSRKTGYEYKAVKWREWRGLFNLYIYNFFTEDFEWMSVLQFENSEKIIKQLTDGKK